MASTRYKGFSIQTRSYQTHASRQWTVDLEIHRNGRRKEFSLTEHYATEREANERCLSLGRLIIDGRIGGWSVDSMRSTGFLQGFSDTHRDRLSAVSTTFINIAILLVLVLGFILVLSRVQITG